MDKLKLIEAILGADCKGVDTNSPFNVGEKIFVRTVTYFLTGKIEKIQGNFITLSSAAWIADTGRFNEALKTGVLKEVEPVPGLVRVNTDTFVDVYSWSHELPCEVK